ncbi:MAG: quinolinate synthase NadA [Thermodesulfobacteriota bacterium]|nr:quinolinate synthase NadA [Thermodesulfobacteriota bacterium]
MGHLELQKKIRKLLKERNAVLLAHYYQRDEIQEIADILGDSLALSIEASRTDADIIVFAGVLFMAESASIISPDKTVLLPRLDAGCSLADMITIPQLKEAKKENPDVGVVTYVNSSAEIKAHSDICCTSANAVRVVNSLKNYKKVLMVPDGNLARYTSRFTDKKIIPWDGYCSVHNFVTPQEVENVKAKYPQAQFAAHPECAPEVLDIADSVGSTEGIIRFAGETDAREIIVGTEIGIMYQLKKQNPGKKFISASDNLICHSMKSITLEDILNSLLEMKHVIKVSEEVRAPAKKALNGMLEVGAED